MNKRHTLLGSICGLALAAGMLASPVLAQEAERSAADRLKELKNKASSSTLRALQKAREEANKKKEAGDGPTAVPSVPKPAAAQTAPPDPAPVTIPRPPPPALTPAPSLPPAPAVPGVPEPVPTEPPPAAEGAPKSVSMGAMEIEDITNTNSAPSSFSMEPSEQLDEGIELEESSVDDELISVTLDDVPLKDVVRMFSRISGANIIASDDLDSRVTVSLVDVEWKVAMEAILDRSGHTMIEKHKGIYSVISKSELAAEPVTVETIILDFVTVSNVLPVVKRMLVSTNASVTPLPAANALVVQETAQQLESINAVIDQLDKPRPQVFIEAKFVELNDQAIEDLGINWEVLTGYTITAGELTRDYSETRRRQEQDAKAAFIVGQDAEGTERLDSIDDNSGFTTSNSSGSSRNTTDDNAIGSVFSNLRTTNESRATNGTQSGTDNRASNSANSRTATTGGGITRNTLNGSINSRSVQNAVLQGVNFEDATFRDDQVTLTPTSPYDRTDIRSAILSADDFQMTLSALKQLDGVEVVSNPKILVANGEEATIHVGRNEPNVVAVPTGDSGDRFAFQLDNELPFIEIGVKLTVRPTINTEENITIKITPELSRLLGQKIVGEANTSFPITQIRKIDTEFNLESGKTVAIGGLTETSENEAVRKVPILGDIPIIGKYLFTHTHTEEIQDEVMIFVTVDMGNPTQLESNTGIPRTSRLIHRYQKKQEKIEAELAAEAEGENDDVDERTVDEILATIKADKEAN